MPSKGTKIASRKAKARRLQNWVASKISKLLTIEWGKDKLIAAREMGQSGTDIRLIGNALEHFPYSVECKNIEKLNLWKALEQTIQNQMPGTNWLLFAKRNNVEPVVILDANVFFDILNFKKTS